MKFWKKLFKTNSVVSGPIRFTEKEVFDSKGKFKLQGANSYVGDMLDSILLIILVHNGENKYFISLELRKCGYIVSYPLLVKVITQLEKQGLLKYGPCVDHRIRDSFAIIRKN